MRPISAGSGYTETVMSATKKQQSADASWKQVESFVDGLHARSRAPIEASAFYRELLEGCVSTLAAPAGAIWLRNSRGQIELIHQINLASVVDRSDGAAWADHQSTVEATWSATEPRILLPHSGDAVSQENPTEAMLLLAPVVELLAGDEALQTDTSPIQARAVVELALRPESSPATQQGWTELLATVCQIAAEFHSLDELRSLRAEQGSHQQALQLLRRVEASTDLRRVALEVANEGRRFAQCDRLSVLLQQGRSWRLQSVSGVDRVELQADTAKRLTELAELTASWGEPLLYRDGDLPAAELPEQIVRVLELHVDQSHARQLIAVPIEFNQASTDSDSSRSERVRPGAVLVAESFDADAASLEPQRVLELGQLCEPALRHATRLDRFPIRTCLRLADRWAQIRESLGLSRLAVALAAVVLLVSSLILIPCDFEISAPATLVPRVERNIFAVSDSIVSEVNVSHGDLVQEGDVLAVLDDPQLALQLQRVAGEIETVGRRLEAITMVRTDRNVREDRAPQQMSLSAEAQILEKKLVSLRKQHEVLTDRRGALTLRSPATGQVLTFDVQHLLRARPVQRGQILFTIADAGSGWRLLVDLPQERVGYLVEAQQTQEQSLPVRFRLAGDVHRVYQGHVEEISTRAVVDPGSLEGAPPPVVVRVSVDEEAPAAARSGMTAQVRILCGRRSLGYVWLHDAWETIYSWLVF